MMIRSSAFLFALLAIVFFSACSDDDSDDLVPEFEHNLVAGVEYHFKLLTDEMDSAQWNIEEKMYSGFEINHTFSGEGDFLIVLTVFQDGIAAGLVTKTINIKGLYETVKISTDFGDIGFYLYQSTPLHRENMVKLLNEKYFDGTSFHRIIEDFMIQGGDPNSKDEDPSNDGQGGPGYTIPRELNENILHIYGAVAGAKKSNETASSGSQFYIVDNVNGTPHLDGVHTVFGQVFYGMDVVKSIAQQPKGVNDRPTSKIGITAELIIMTPAQLKEDYDFDIPTE